MSDATVREQAERAASEELEWYGWTSALPYKPALVGCYLRGHAEALAGRDAEVERLRQWVRQFGDHPDWCAQRINCGHECGCGLRAALEDAR
jgi:hypothetical protein